MSSARILCVVVAAVVLSGCAARQRQDRLYAWAGEYVYARSAEALLPGLQAYFQKKGVGIKPSKNERGYFLLSEWREEFAGSRVTGNSWRLYVELRPLGPERSSVRIFRHSIFTGGKAATRNGAREAFRTGVRADDDEVNVNSPYGEVKSSRLTRFSRDRALEWEVLKQLAPQDAAAEEARFSSE
jgi:hypothetical protein